MATQAYTVPVGSPLYFRPGGQPYSFCAQPSGGGTVAIAMSIDGGFTYLPAAPGAIATPYSFNNFSPLPSGSAQSTGLSVNRGYAVEGTIVQVIASTASANVSATDIAVPAPYGADKVNIATYAIAYTMPNSTNEQTLWSMRFHPGFFRTVDPDWSLCIDAWFTLTNNANAKTLKCYFGPTAYSSATGLEGGTSAGSQAMASFSGYHAQYLFGGRNDGQTVIAGTLGSAGGYGGNATANVTVSNCNYSGSSAVEQVITLTGTKATGTDTLTLDCVRMTYFL